MRILALEINGFRGVQESRLVLSDRMTFVGPNGAGKSTVIDALSLALGRQKLVRELTEHDFTGSHPREEDRIIIVVTIGGFSSDNPEQHRQWFRSDRAIEKWWNPATAEVEAVRSDGTELCVQVGYAARFDYESLEVKHLRYFPDDTGGDPFDEETVVRFPEKLMGEIGFFVLPARRTWAATISFASDLFRKAVAATGGIPAETVLAQRDMLRNPDPALENDPQLKPLIDRINSRMRQILPGVPTLQLRLTSTDSQSFLESLVPHYEIDGGPSLPAARHGTGLISLQILALLLEIGRARKTGGNSFILAVEEAELHVPPGLQRRMIGDAAAVSDQLICTTHSPRVAAFFEPACIQLLIKSRDGNLEGRQLAPNSMVNEPNALIQLYTDHRSRLVEALMFQRVLVPEGRLDFEWVRLLLDAVETGERPEAGHEMTIPPFGSIVGVVPTRDAHVKETYKRLSSLHDEVFVLVDGDNAGDGYVTELIALQVPPRVIVQWPAEWGIEDAVGWAIEADAETALSVISERLGRPYQSVAALLVDLKSDNGREGGLKAHYIAHEQIAGAMKRSPRIVSRAEYILGALTRAALQEVRGIGSLLIDGRSNDRCTVYRFQP